MISSADDGFDVGVARQSDNVVCAGVGNIKLIGELSVVAAYGVGEASGNSSRDRYRHGGGLIS